MFSLRATFCPIPLGTTVTITFVKGKYGEDFHHLTSAGILLQFLCSAQTHCAVNSHQNAHKRYTDLFQQAKFMQADVNYINSTKNPLVKISVFVVFSVLVFHSPGRNVSNITKCINFKSCSDTSGYRRLSDSKQSTLPLFPVNVPL